MPGGRTVVDCYEFFVAIEGSKFRHAVVVGDGGRDGEVRFYGEIGSDIALRRGPSAMSGRPGRSLRCSRWR